jgi:hypothetical protein
MAAIRKYLMGGVLIDDVSQDIYPVTEPSCKIGSAPTCDIVLPPEGVSPTHVRIEKRGDDYWCAIIPGAALTRRVNVVMTIPSCTLNRKALDGKLAKMSPGDKLQVGEHLLVFHIM